MSAVVAIVDDDESLRRSLANLLSSAGYRAETFASAEAFLLAPLEPAPSCLILDVRMGPMSGIELFAELRRRGTRTPAVILTAYEDAMLLRRANELGARAFLTKPFQPDALLVAVAAAIAGR